MNMYETINFAESMRKLEEINEWFQNEDIDLEEGLKKMREGKNIIKRCREKLLHIENEFIKIKKEFSEEIKSENIIEVPSLNGDKIPF